MLYNTLVKKLDDRDRDIQQKTPVLTSLLTTDDHPKTKLNPIPDPIPTPKRRKLIEPPTASTTTTYRSIENFTPRSTFTGKKYYCYSKMQIKKMLQ
jgi:hypothetical protein